MTDFIFPNIPSMRLDQALGLIQPLGLRGRQELIRNGLVFLDDRKGRKGDTVCPGQKITILENPPQAVEVSGIRIVEKNDSFAALFKPAGMHTVRGKGVCLEDGLAGFGLGDWTLLNRLDFLTSGLVLAALDPDDAASYKNWQECHNVQKYYLALVHGVISEDMEITNRILDDDRKVVRVTDESDIPLRKTHVRPLEQFEGQTLLLIGIYRGRRHQIRAHLASVGFPLVGDPVYGQGEPGGLYLHHALLKMPGFIASILPDWPIPLEKAAVVISGLALP